MPVYATVSDLVGWQNEADVPDNAAALLRSASYRVTDAVKTAVFDVNPAGLPVDADLKNALRDATCAQVAMWTGLGNDPALGGLDSQPAISSKRIGSGGYSYDTSLSGSVTAFEARRDLIAGLCDEAQLILDQAGLLGSNVVVW